MARVKKKEHEKLSNENIRKVIELLSGDNPITKKEACQILNIAYNTTRLNKIIEEFNERQAYIAKMKQANKGKPATSEEISRAITEYLEGESISTIAKDMFRSSGFINSIISRIGVPQRPASAQERAKATLLPDACVSEIFNIGEIVWSAKYHSPAKIKQEVNNIDYEKKYGSKCYLIDIIEDIDSTDSFFPHITKGGFSAHSLAYDIGKLSHLEEYGVSLSRI